MATKAKPVGDLTVEDLTRHPVWEFDLASETRPGSDETWVKPIEDLPVTKLENAIVAATVRLSAGLVVPGLLGNIALFSPRRTREFLDLTLFHENRKYWLARYFDADFDTRGPTGLAAFFGLSLDEVFPLSYEISRDAVVGDEEVTSGRILAEPRQRLSNEERTKLIFSALPKPQR